MNGGKIKKDQDYSTGRGYSGYHVSWDNQKVFCRSTLEKIQACLLDKEKIPYLMEKEIYQINGNSYKPDFFIYLDISSILQ